MAGIGSDAEDSVMILGEIVLPHPGNIITVYSSKRPRVDCALVGGIAFQASSEARQGNVLQAGWWMMRDFILERHNVTYTNIAELSQSSALTPNRVNLYQVPVNISNLDRAVTQSPSALAKKRRNGTAVYVNERCD